MKRLLTLLVLLLPTITWAGFITQPNGLNTAGNYVLTGSWDFSGATVTGIGVTETLNTVSTRGNTNYVSNSLANGMQVGSSANQHVRLGDDPTTGQFVKCVAAGTVNNCDYGPQLNSGKRFRLGDRNNDDMIAFTETTNGTTTAWRERTNDDTTPATGYWAPYFKSDGFYYKDDAGNVTGPLISANDIVRFGAADAAANDTDYLLHAGNFGSGPVSSTNETGRAMMGFTGTVREMRCEIATAPTSTNTITFTVATSTTMAGALSDSSMTAQITGTATTTSTTTNPATVTVGQYVGIKKVDSASATPSGQTLCVLRIEK